MNYSERRMFFDSFNCNMYYPWSFFNENYVAWVYFFFFTFLLLLSAKQEIGEYVFKVGSLTGQGSKDCPIKPDMKYSIT